MKLYDKDGWLNIENILSIPTPFIFVVGGRGIGKTYGAIKYVIENNKKFMLSRRTQKQADLIASPEFSPLKSPCEDLGIDWECASLMQQCSGIYTECNGEMVLSGYTSALSTLSNIRGFDSSDVMIWIYDEFIPERHERLLRYEGEGFLNAYETINRNRELKGEPPLKFLGLTNSNDLSNPIFEVLDLVDVAEKMQNRGKEVYINSNRGITIIMPRQSPISEMKKKTALYNAVGSDSRFTEMSISNEFETEICVMSKNLNEYKILVSVGKMHIYEHKSNGTFYVSAHKNGTGMVYGTDSTSLIQFRTAYRYLHGAYITDRILFESTRLKRAFENYFIIRT